MTNAHSHEPVAGRDDRAWERLELAIEGAALGTWDWDIVSGETIYNARWAEIIGCKLSEVQPHQQSWEKLVHPDDYPKVMQQVRAHLEGLASVYQAEYRLRHRDGRWIWVLAHGRVYERDPDGRPLRAAGIHQDITQRKEAEEALLLSREMYKHTIALTQQFPWIAGPDGAVIHIDPVWLAFTGRDVAAVLGDAWLESVHPDDREPMYAYWKQCVQAGQPYRWEHRVRSQDGQYRYVESRAQPQRNANGEIVRWYGTSEDVHERTIASQRLRATEQSVALALEGAQLSTWDWNVRTNQVLRSARWFELLGYREGEVPNPSNSWTERVHPDDLAELLSAFQAHCKGETPNYRAEYRVCHRSGEWRWMLSHGRVVERDQDGPVRACGINRDITERRLALDALANSEQFSRLLLEGYQDCVTLLDVSGCMLYLNPAGLQRLGISDLEQAVGRSWIDLWGPENRTTLLTSIQLAFSGQPTTFEAFCHLGGALAGWWNVLLSPLPPNPGKQPRILAVAREITALKKQDEQQRVTFERERLQAILENLNEGIIIAQPDGTVLLMNRAAHQMYGFRTSEGELVNCRDLIEAIDAGDAFDRSLTQERPLTRALRGEAFHDAETYFRNRRTGHEWVGNCGSTPVRSATGELLLAVLSVRDVTAERKAADEIRRANQVLHELSGRLLRLQDDERRGIARELHDGTVQLLSAALMNLTVLSDSPVLRGAEFENRLLSKTLDLTQQGVKELRTMSYLLHPPVLDELGLAPALRSWIDGFSERTGLPVDIEMIGEVGRLAARVETALFRITQEALGNVHRHADSTSAGVRLEVSEETISLEITDDGKGFEWAREGAAAVSHKFGVGLLGMRERANQLGGSMTVDSRPGKTMVRVKLPRITTNA